MRTTLFLLPAELAGQPLVGFGLLFFAWIAIGLVGAIILWQRPETRREIPGYLPVYLLVAAVIAFVLPTLVEAGPGGKPLGLPIRGYGVMLTLATISAVGLAAHRARQVGIDPDHIYSLAIAMFVAGIIGARIFYVAEYWNEEFSPQRTGGLLATLLSVINIPKGGLVVYGSVLFGVPAGIWYCLRHGLRVLAIGDIIAPSMVVGLALGRVGCFLNGCCFGGVCLNHSYALTFPAESPPYMQHERFGWHSGVWLIEKDKQIVVGYLDPAGPASKIGLKTGDEITAINGAAISGATPELVAEARQKLASGQSGYELATADGRVVRWSAAPAPSRSVPIHPAQLYAALDAALLACLLWFYFPYRTRDGEVFAILLTVHPITRFLIEIVRSDEPKFPLTVSQWISIGLLIAGIALWVFIERGPRRAAPAASSA